MSRMFQVLAVMLVVFAASADAAEVVSIKLCAVADYDASTKDCAPGKALQGENIMVDPAAVKSLYLLTSVKTDSSEDVYHVWIATGKSSSNTLDQSQLDWLKERNIEGAQAIVKLSVAPSPRYRTRSSKILTPRSAGPWKVQVFDATGMKPLAELSFAVTAPATTTTEQN